MKKIQVIFFLIIVLFGLSACSSDEIPFTITNPTKQEMVVGIDGEKYSIAPSSVEKITLAPGLHNMVTERLGAFEFMVYATMEKGGVINPSMQDYVLVKQSYRNLSLLKTNKTQFVFEPWSAHIKFKPNFKNNLHFQYYSNRFFIDKGWTYDVDEELPGIIQKDGDVTQKFINEFKLFSLDDYIEFVGEEFYQTYFRRALNDIETEKKQHTESEVLALISNIETNPNSQSYQSLIDVSKNYLTADTAKKQRQLAKSIHKMKSALFTSADSSDVQKRDLWSKAVDLTTYLYTSGRIMDVSGASDPSSSAGSLTPASSSADTGGVSIFKYILYGVIILIAFLILVVLPIVIYKLLSNDEIKWHDENSFDNTSRNFALTAASVYNHGVRIDAYKEISESDASDTQESLRSAWTTTNKQELLSTLESLRTDTHRGDQTRLAGYVNSLNEDEFKQHLEELDDYDQGQAKLVYKQSEYTAKSFMAWDLLRYFFIAHNGVLAGYITINEFDEIIQPVKATVQKNYDSWKDFFEHFLLGRMMWKAGEDDLSVSLFKTRVKSLLTKDESPCKKVEWNCEESKEPLVSPKMMSDITFWEIIESVNNNEITTFLPRLEGKLNQLSDDDIFCFDAKVAHMIETFNNPVYQYGASMFLSGDINRYSLLVWLIYQGQHYYEDALKKPDDVFTKAAKAFKVEYQKNDQFIVTLEEGLSLFSISKSIAESRQLNPLGKSYTYEERRAINEKSCQAMPMTENPYPQLMAEISSWS